MVTPSRHDRMASETRREILLTARRLFGERGYADTSIADISADAGVAVQTIYARVGSKRGMLLALVDLVDEEANLAVHLERLSKATTGRAVVREFASLTRAYHEHCRDIVAALYGAGLLAPELRDAAQEGRRRHRGGARQVVQQLQQLDALRPGMDPIAAAGLCTVLTAHEAWNELVDDHGLAYDAAEEWIVAALIRSLLGR